MKILAGFIVLFIVSCAEPKYVNEKSNSPDHSAHEAASDCSTRFSSSRLCVSWYWNKKPTASEAGSFIFKTYRLNSFDETALETDPIVKPEILLWMTSMGHGSSPVETVQLDVGTFRAENVFFIMPGEWEIKFQIKDGDNVNDEAVAFITL